MGVVTLFYQALRLTVRLTLVRSGPSRWAGRNIRRRRLEPRARASASDLEQCLLLDWCLPAEGVVWIVKLLSDRGHLQRFLRLDHYCQFVRRVFSDARFHSPWLGSVVYSSPV